MKKKELVRIALPVEQDVRTIPHLKNQSPEKIPRARNPWKTSGW